MTEDKKGADPGFVEEQYRETLNDLAQTLDEIFNEDFDNRKVGFALFVFEFGKGGRLNYVSNARRADMIKVVEEWLEHARADEGPEVRHPSVN